jgi:hypothetical protein
MRQFFGMVWATLVLGLFASTASAGPLFDLQVLGSTTQNGTYSSSLVVTSGETIYYEVTIQELGIGSSNKTANKTITSINPGLDGCNSISFNINNTSTSTIATNFTSGVTLNTASGWGTILSANSGTATATGVTGVIGGLAAGTYLGYNGSPAVVATGTFTTGSSLGAGLSTSILGSFGGTNSGFSINGGGLSGKIIASLSSEVNPGTDPYIGYVGLGLSTAPNAVPEPASIAMLGFSSVVVGGVMAVRNRKAKAKAKV